MQACHQVILEKQPMKSIDDIEKSIIKTYRKDIFRPFIKAIEEFELLKAHDKVAVAISGGKDSLLLAKLFQEIKKHNKFPFDVVFITMDPGYAKENMDLLIQNAKDLNIPIQIFKSEIFKVISDIANEHPCYLCARMRRGFLYKTAKDLGCNKLALGHHFDDMIETTLLNMFYNGTFKTMVPKIKAENFEDIELIRPMIKVKENAIIRWANRNGIYGLNCGCTVAAKKTSSKRREIKQLIEQLRKINPNIDLHIYKSAFHVNLEAIMGFHTDDAYMHFVDIYEGRHKK